MKKIVVDTNLIFSCLLNSQNMIGELIFNSSVVFEFYSNDYMRHEIRKHWAKLLKISTLAHADLETAYEKLLTRIFFLNDELMPVSARQKQRCLFPM